MLLSNHDVINHVFPHVLQNGTASALPYLAMWIFSMLLSVVTDWMISTHLTHTAARRIVNSIGKKRVTFSEKLFSEFLWFWYLLCFS